MVEPPGLHQDGLNSLKRPQLSLHNVQCTCVRYFPIAKEKKLKLGKVEAQNHSASPSDHYLPQFTCKEEIRSS